MTWLPSTLHPSDADLVASLPAHLWAVNGVPDERAARARGRAADLAVEALGHLLMKHGVRTSTLGPEWSHDIDLHLNALPAASLLRERGWLSLDAVLRSIGSHGDQRWVVVENGHVLAPVDLHLSPPPDPLTRILERCRERGQVRLREVLELRTLVRSGRDLPLGPPALRVAADVEAALGGNLLRSGGSGPGTMPPVRLPARLGPRLFRWAAYQKGRLRPRVVIALSGVDGAGKSTLVAGLRAELSQAGVPVGTVWSRPGMGLGRAAGLAALAKRVLKQDSAPGVRAMAAGTGPELRSRRGVVGWAWALLVAVAFVLDSRRQQARSRGVILWDRHVYDALATFDFAYAGSSLALPRSLVRRLLPRAAVTFYLELPAAEAISRKPGDSIGEHAVRRQLDSYRRYRASIPDLHVLDATLPPEQNLYEALRILLNELPV